MREEPGKSTNVRALNGATLRRKIRTNVRVLSLQAVGASIGSLARLAPDAALEVATYLFFRPQRTQARAPEIAAIEGAQPLRVELGGRTLHGYRWGDRSHPPVLLVHGWSGRAGQLWAFVEPLVQRGRQVIAFDLTGHGSTPGRQASIVALADDVLQLGAQFGPFEAVIAHSFGGPVTTLAMVAGLAVERAVFIAPPFDATDWVAAFARWMRFDGPLLEALRQRLEDRVGLAFSEVSAAQLVPELKTPLLVVHDTDDREVGFANGERLAATWPGAILHPTEGLGHQRILGDRAVVERAVGFATGAPDAARAA